MRISDWSSDVCSSDLFIGPIHRRTKAAELAGNFAAAFFFPLPDPGDELIAREISALLTLGVHLPLNHHLRGDARMISANHPQRILAAQPFITEDRKSTRLNSSH